MIGKIVFQSGGQEMEAVLGQDGYWTCPDSAIEFDLNTDLNCDGYSPADGQRGLKQLHAAAERWGGRVESPKAGPPTDGLIY